jgi:hypothetical protein
MASVLDHITDSTTFQALSTSAQTDSITISGGTNRRMIVFCGGEEDEPSPTVDSVSFNGTSMTQIGGSVEISGSFSNVITAWTLKDSELPSAGTYTLSMSFSGVGEGDWEYFHWCVFVLDDADQGSFTSSEYDTATVSSSDTLTFSTGVSVANGDVVCIGGNTSSNATHTITGYTVKDETMGGAGFFSAEKAVTGSGTESPSVVADASETRFVGFLVKVKDYVAGGVSAIPPRLQNLENQFSAIIASGLNGVLQ